MGSTEKLVKATPVPHMNNIQLVRRIHIHDMVMYTVHITISLIDNCWTVLHFYGSAQWKHEMLWKSK